MGGSIRGKRNDDSRSGGRDNKVFVAVQKPDAPAPHNPEHRGSWRGGAMTRRRGVLCSREKKKGFGDHGRYGGQAREHG